MAQLKKLDNNNQNDKQEIDRLFGQAPEWVNFISFDDDGQQSWYEEKPFKLNGGYLASINEKVKGRFNNFPFDGLHFENQTYCSCCVERPRFKSKGASHPNLEGFEPTEATPAYQVVRDVFNGLRNWRLTRQNKAAKEAASEVERLINCGK